MPIGADGELDRNQHDLVFGYIWLLHGNIKTCMPNLVSYCFFLFVIFVCYCRGNIKACMPNSVPYCLLLFDRSSHKGQNNLNF